MIYLVTIYDGANFDARMGSRRAFTNWSVAQTEAVFRVRQLQQERREEGETDEAFVESIYSRIDEIELDARWS